MFGLSLGLKIIQAPKLELKLENQCTVCGLNMEDDDSRRLAICANIAHVVKYSFCTGCGNHVEVDRSHGYKCRWTRRAKKRLRAIDKHGLADGEVSLVGITYTDSLKFIQRALVVLYRRGEVTI